MSDAPPVYYEGSKMVIRASMVGASEKALIALMMGFDPADPTQWMEEKFAEGHRLEPVIIDMVQDERGTLIGGQQEEVEVTVTPEIVIRGHLDGIENRGSYAGDERMVEVKAFTESMYKDVLRGRLFDNVPRYRDQLTIYMKATGLPALYATGLKVEGEGGNVTVDEVHLEEIDTPPNDIASIKAKVIKAAKRAEKGDLPEECCGGDYFCPVYYLHENQDRELVDGEMGEELDRLCTTAVEARKKEKMWAKTKKEANKAIEEILREKGVDRGESAAFKFTLVTPTRTRLDKGKLEEDGIDLSQYETEFSYSYPRITAKQQEGASA